MPRGPKGERRPADVIGNAVKIMRIATGEEPEDYGPESGKNKAAQELGRKGGKKRAESITPERRGDCEEGGPKAVESTRINPDFRFSIYID
jgi:hypothetical protein